MRTIALLVVITAAVVLLLSLAGCDRQAPNSRAATLLEVSW